MAVDLDSSGNLPPGIHWFTRQELVEQFGGNPHRQRLLAGLKHALDDLKSAGCRTAYVDGSFVTNKKIPGDFDACWDLDGMDLRRLVDTPLLNFDNGRAVQKATYSGELFPANIQADSAGRRFLDFFQVDKVTGEPKGIIALDLEGIS